jgi:hypothetical protein
MEVTPVSSKNRTYNIRNPNRVLCASPDRCLSAAAGRNGMRSSMQSCHSSCRI